MAKPTNTGLSLCELCGSARDTFYLSPATLENAEAQSLGPVKFAVLVPVGNFTA